MADGFRPGDLRGLGCDRIGEDQWVISPTYMEYIEVITLLIWVVVSNIFYFHPLLGEMIQFD